jgi:hypothetical protein
MNDETVTEGYVHLGPESLVDVTAAIDAFFLRACTLGQAPVAETGELAPLKVDCVPIACPNEGVRLAD